MRVCVGLKWREEESLWEGEERGEGGEGGGVLYIYIYKYTLPVLPCSECSSSS